MQIHFNNETSEEVLLILDESQNRLQLKSQKSGDQLLAVDLPFKISKIPPQRQDLNHIQEDVIVFRNKYFSQFDICEVRMGSGQNKNRRGFLFKPFLIFENDGNYLYKDDRILQIAIFRAIAMLLLGKGTLEPDILDASRQNDYLLKDLFPEDIIVGVFPYEWNEGKKINFVEISLNLFLSGFYALSQGNERSFIPPDNNLQREKLASIKFQSKSHRQYLDIQKVEKVITSNGYCLYYLQNLTKLKENVATQFYQLYGLVEIFKDEALKCELSEKMANHLSKATGHKIQQLVLQISKDQYCVDKLIDKYGHAPNEIKDLAYWETLYFLESCRDKSETDKLIDFPQAFYYLRNILVHDIQFIFKDGNMSSATLREELYRVFIVLEYVILNTLQSARFLHNGSLG